MNFSLRDELKVLVQNTRGPCVSIFMPTHRAGVETSQNPIKLTNLLKQADRQLQELGVRGAEARELLGQVDELVKDPFFWRKQADGLAVFISPEIFRTYQLPLIPDELVVVTNRFHLKPLLRLFSVDGRFYILALSQKDVRLFQCTRYGISEVSLNNTPRSIAEALKYDDLSNKQQFHTRVAGHSGNTDSMFRGHGTGVDDPKIDILRYFLKINDGVRNVLKDDQAPLILAAVDYLLPLYREANTHTNLLEEGITGNPDGLSPQELHKQAWPLVEPYFRKVQETAGSKLMDFTGTGLSSNDIEEIIAAAYFGRIDTLFVATGLHRWGLFAPEINTVQIHEQPEPGDEDLLDYAALQTYLHRGAVYTVKPEEIPGEGPAAALFRY